jgi:hypothetical protein
LEKFSRSGKASSIKSGKDRKGVNMTAKLFVIFACLAGLLTQAYGQDELRPLLEGGCAERCESVLYQKVWIHFEDQAGIRSSIDTGSIQPTQNGGFSAMTYTGRPDLPFDPRKLRRLFFNCKGQVFDFDSNSIGMKEFGSRSVGAQVERSICQDPISNRKQTFWEVEKLDTQFEIHKNKTPNKEGMVDCIESEINSKFYRKSDGGLSAIRIANACIAFFAPSIKKCMGYPGKDFGSCKIDAMILAQAALSIKEMQMASSREDKRQPTQNSGFLSQAELTELDAKKAKADPEKSKPSVRPSDTDFNKQVQTQLQSNKARKALAPATTNDQCIALIRVASMADAYVRQCGQRPGISQTAMDHYSRSNCARIAGAEEVNITRKQVQFDSVADFNREGSEAYCREAGEFYGDKAEMFGLR